MPQKFAFRKSKEVSRALENLGYSLVSQRGSHMKYSCAGKVLILPNHDELATGTLNQIYKIVCKTCDVQKVDALFLRK